MGGLMNTTRQTAAQQWLFGLQRSLADLPLPGPSTFCANSYTNILTYKILGSINFEKVDVCHLLLNEKGSLP
jgi:hypothetical protein